MWEIEFTDEFRDWWDELTESEQDAVTYSVNLLRQEGAFLTFPHCSSVEQSRHKKMRELRSRCKGHPLRTFYAFDSKRNAILLIGGDKTGNDRFYDEMIPKADKIYDDYLKEIQEEQ